MKRRGFMFRIMICLAMTTGFAYSMDEDVKQDGRHMIEHDDQNGDGKISEEEFPGPDEHFSRIDLNGDGFIDLQEAGQAPPPPSRERRIPGGFYRDDVKGDGEVSRSEFSGPADHFDRLDLNGDGAIQESEARQGPPEMSRGQQKEPDNPVKKGDTP